MPRTLSLKLSLTLATACFLALGSLSIAQAQVPERLHYQGFLTNASGQPVECLNPLTCDQPLDMIFRLHPDAFSETVLWNETQAGVIVDGGLFNVILGSIEPIPAEVFAGAAFLSIEINNNGELDNGVYHKFVYSSRDGGPEPSSSVDDAKGSVNDLRP